MNFRNQYLFFLISFLFFGKLFSQQDSIKLIQDNSNPYQTYKEYKDSMSSVFDTLSILDKAYLRNVDSIWSNRLGEGIFDTLGNKKSVTTKLPADTIRKMMEELNASTPMTLSYNTVTSGYIDRYLKGGKYMNKIVGLSKFYYPLFEEALDKYDIPLEIKHLAVVESALNPTAGSRVGAKGLWQFMYETGKMYDLNVNSYVDERYDPIKSTEAACKYLSYLYRMFKDWDLALAAYNCGPGNVMKAIKRGNTTNYWQLRKYLPRETSSYVPAFIGYTFVLENAEKLGLGETPVKQSLYQTDTLTIHQTVTFKQLSDNLDISIDDLRFLNPAYKKDIIPSTTKKKYSIRLPKDKILTFLTNEKGFYDTIQKQNEVKKEEIEKIVKNATKAPVKKKRYHTIRRGETLSTIARRYGVSVNSLKRWNGIRGTRITAGKKLVIYSSSGSSSSRSYSSSKKYHTVRKGESLYVIAKRYRTTVSKLKQINGLKSNNLSIGKKLRVK